MLRRVLLLSLALSAALCLRAAPALPQIPDKSTDVTTLGVVADGQTDNAAALQKAIDETSASGGGRLVFPANAQPYLSGPIVLRSGVGIHLSKGATLSPLPYGGGTGAPGSYPLPKAGQTRYTNFISSKGVENIALTGEGVIEGNGAAWWDAFRANKKMPSRPYLIRLEGSKKVLITDITLSNSPMFHLAFNTTDDVTIERVKVRAPADAPNTDGIDPAGSRYLIKNCDISTGDDNIAVKAGGTFCSDIVITDCVFGTGHGVSVGGQSNSGLDGMVVTNCTFNGTNSGIRLKADPTQGGPVRNITYSNLTMNNVKYPISFYSYYNKVGNPGAGKHLLPQAAEWNSNPPNSLATKTQPSWRDITLKDITVNGGNNYSVIWGLPTADGLFADVRFINVRYNGRRGFLLYNVGSMVLAGVQFQIEGQNPPITTYNSLVITRQPPSQRAKRGGTVTFETAATGGAGAKQVTPKYEWTFEGKTLKDGTLPDGTEISGAMTAKLTLKNVQPGVAGRYIAIASTKLDTFDPVENRLVPEAYETHAITLTAMLAVQ